jgi:N4-gp56 family major capsid protein
MNWTNQGSYLTNNKLNKMFQKEAQEMCRFRQFVKFKEAFGSHQGASVNWLKVSNVADRGHRLAETSAMPESRVPLAWGTLTVHEYGMSIPFTFKAEILSEFDLMSIMREGLLDDAVKVIDGSIERQFNATKLRYVGTATNGKVTSTDGTTTKTNTSIFNAYHVREMAAMLKKRNVPGFSGLGGDYVCICSVDAMKGLYSDLEDIWQYTETGHKKILNGEVGRYYNVRFVEDSFATQNIYNVTTGTTTAISWSGAKSGVAYMFGSPTVREAVVEPEHIRMKVTTDYGRSKGIGWYFLGGWKIEWEDAADTRIVKWDSKA